MPRVIYSRYVWLMKRNVPINSATLYSGHSRHTIDGSNRIMMPSEWRVAGAPLRFFVIVSPAEDHLIICPPPVFETFLAEVRADTVDKTQIPAIERELNDRVRQVSLDRFGRLPLPREFTTRTGIDQHGEMVGRFSKFEIWAQDKLESPRLEREDALATVTRKLQSI